MGTCLICDRLMVGTYHPTSNPEGRAKEHAIPKWLQKELGLLRFVTDETLRRPAQEIVAGTGMRRMAVQAPPRRMVLEQRQHGGICGKCNGGWMSSLENDTIPILTPLVRGEGTISELSDAQRRTLARWMLKTAFVLNTSEQATQFVPTSFIHDVREGRLPDGVTLFARELDAVPSQPYQKFSGRHMAISHNESWHADDVNALAAQHWKLAVSLGRLQLLIVFWPDPSWLYATWPIHRLVWPLNCRMQILPTCLIPPLDLNTIVFSLAVTTDPLPVEPPMSFMGTQGLSMAYRYEIRTIQAIEIHFGFPEETQLL